MLMKYKTLNESDKAETEGLHIFRKLGVTEV